MRKVLAFVMSVGLATAAGSAMADTSKTAGQKVDDTVITTKVKSALIANEATKARQINVETNKGVVQLSGFVDNATAKAAAEQTAGGVAGVQSVQNKLLIRAGERSAGTTTDDTVIAAKVKSEIAGKSGLGTATDVNVEVNAGVVELSGFVSSADQKTKAADIARRVEGVTDVKNNLSLKSKS